MAKILIADDSRISRRMLADIVKPIGFSEIIEAVDGQDAVNKFKENFPDVVTLDITMPVMDGIAALKEIKKIRPDAKVIMITAAAQNTKIVEAVKLGASEFISKPYENDQIESVLRHIYEEIER